MSSVVLRAFLAEARGVSALDARLRATVPEGFAETALESDDSARLWMCSDWIARGFAEPWLTLTGNAVFAARIRALPPVENAEGLSAAVDVFEALEASFAKAPVAAGGPPPEEMELFSSTFASAGLRCAAEAATAALTSGAFDPQWLRVIALVGRSQSGGAWSHELARAIRERPDEVEAIVRSLQGEAARLFGRMATASLHLSREQIAAVEAAWPEDGLLRLVTADEAMARAEVERALEAAAKAR